MGMAETPPTGNERSYKVDLRFWQILQEVCHAGFVLKTQHEKTYKLGPQIKKSGDRDEKAELDILHSTGGEQWMKLAKALDKIEGGNRNAGRDGNVEVYLDEMNSRADVKISLRLLVDNMFALADKKDLLRKGTITKHEAGTIKYRGPRMGPALQGAFNALAEWDNYMAEAEASKLFARLTTQAYKPPSGNNTLALPAPAMPSQHPTTPPGLK